MRSERASLTAEQIPMGARILSVCDCFDAMTSDRPYIRARSSAEAVHELRRNSGTQFDPQVVERFCALMGAGAFAEILAQPRAAAEPAATQAARPEAASPLPSALPPAAPALPEAELALGAPQPA